MASIKKKIDTGKEVPEGLRKAYNVHASRPATRKTTKVEESGVGEFTLEKFQPVGKGEAPTTKTVGELDVYAKSPNVLERKGATVVHSKMDPETKGKGLGRKLYTDTARRLGTGKWSWGVKVPLSSEDRSTSAHGLWKGLESRQGKDFKITTSPGDPSKKRQEMAMYDPRHPNIDVKQMHWTGK